MYMAVGGWRDEETGKLEVNDREEFVCCAKCAVDTQQWPDLVIIGHYVHYEGPPEECEYCNSFTESAYGDPNE